MDSRIEAAAEITNKIRSARKYYFAELKPSQLEDGLAVVYAITNCDTEEVLYVGRTKNLRRRLYTNHLMGPASNARLKKYLVEDDREPTIVTMEDAKRYLKDHCYFQYIAVEGLHERGKIEGLLSYMLDVRYIDEEH